MKESVKLFFYDSDDIITRLFLICQVFLCASFLLPLDTLLSIQQGLD